MKVPFGDSKLHYQAYKTLIDEGVAPPLDSGHFILGPELESFEKEFSQYLGCEYTIGCASGTEAIYLALAASGVGEGDEVLTVAHTARTHYLCHFDDWSDTGFRRHRSRYIRDRCARSGRQIHG